MSSIAQVVALLIIIDCFFCVNRYPGFSMMEGVLDGMKTPLSRLW